MGLFNIFKKENKPSELELENKEINQVVAEHKEINLEQERFKKYVEEISDYAISICSDTKLNKNMLSEMPDIELTKIPKSYDKTTKFASYASITVWTTGLKASKDSITEIAAMRFEELEPVDCFHTFIKSDEHPDAPTLDQISADFIKYIGKNQIVGFHLPIDLKFLYVNGIDLISKRKIYDVYEMGVTYYEIEGFNFASLCEPYHAIYEKDSSIKYDCAAIGVVFNNLLDDLRNKDKE